MTLAQDNTSLSAPPGKLIVSFSPVEDLGEDFLPYLEGKVKDHALTIEGMPDEDFLHLAVTRRTEAGEYVGGLYAYGMLNWLNIHALYVEPGSRSLGIGTEFLKAAEEAVRKRDYAGVILYAVSAVPFYQRFGYTVATPLPNRPRGKTSYILTKSLDGTSA